MSSIKAIARQLLITWLLGSSFFGNTVVVVVHGFAPKAVLPNPGAGQVPGILPRAAPSPNDQYPESEEEDCKDADPIFYDDFAENTAESLSFYGSYSEPSTEDLASLSERVLQVQSSDRTEAARVRKNWEQANWKVRGFSLDTIDCKAMEDEPASGTTGIHITTLTRVMDPLDETEQLVWVGRSDGSLILVRLGSDFRTRFQSTLTLQPSTEDTVVVESRLKPEDGDGPWSANNDGTTTDSIDKDPFVILCETQAYTGRPMAHVVDSMHCVVYTVSQGDSHIVPWLVPKGTTNADDDSFSLVAQPALQSVHSTPIIGLDTVALTNDESAPTLLTSVSADGTLAVWDIPGGDLLFTCQIDNDLDPNVGDDDTSTQSAITSATASHGFWILGRANGSLLAYRIDQLVEATAENRLCPLPACEWQANPRESAITAVHSLGPSTLGQSKPSIVVISGDSDGVVQQWDLLERRGADGPGLLDVWPKMARQRLPGRAHLFQGHEDAISSITSTENNDFVVTASYDGTVRAWDPSTGQVATRMDGFDEYGCHSLCLMGDDLLVTGNGGDVTVHDFTAADDEYLDQIE